MKQKIAVISFDNWNYDGFIVEALKKSGHESVHIKLNNYKYKNIAIRIKNALSKALFKKNLKEKLIENFILEKLQEQGEIDQILVINPSSIDKKFHLIIKQFTKKYIAYLYDSIDRYDVTHLMNGVFDKIYSFDKNDVEKHGFILANNYNYLALKTIDLQPKTKQKVVCVCSIDDRINQVYDFANFFKENAISFKFYVVGKKHWIYELKKLWNKILNTKQAVVFEEIIFLRNTIAQDKLLGIYSQSEVILDLAHHNQTGLSFRIFEAMGLHKKVITTNPTIKSNDFYAPTNFCACIDDKSILLPFIKTPFVPLDQEIYQKYTIENWVKEVFLGSENIVF